MEYKTNNNHYVITLPIEECNFSFFYHRKENEVCVVAYNNIENVAAPFLRIHSSCLFSETFGTTDCDCASQLDIAIQTLKNEGGIIIYIFQEGRGIGLEKKIQAIALQQKSGLNTLQAFEKLGYVADPRSYEIAIEALKILKIDSVKLATNNPEKIRFLENSGIVVVDRIQISTSNENNREYVKSKCELFGHYESN